jgi:AmmeMemoRadiSam system protein B
VREDRWQIRPAAVAGSFYPADPHELRRMVSQLLDEAEAEQQCEQDPPRALIAPHAGYIYSGPIAASAYLRLRPLRDTIRRIVLLGPSHRLALPGLASSSADAFATPLGLVPIDRAAVARAETLPFVRCIDAAHASEHSLEVQLPFLQCVLRDFQLVPFSVGDASAAEVAEVIDLLSGGPETVVVVSSDLSHYYDYEAAQRLDAETTGAIERLDPGSLHSESACGRVPVRGLLTHARARGLSVRTLDLRNSGDTQGSRDQVVGYGAYLFA